MPRTVGIDLGTTNSVVAVMEGGEPRVIPNAEGSNLTPSVVGFTKSGERLVGAAAKRQAILNPDRTISSIKRKMGTNHRVTIDGKNYSPEEISAMILQKLKTDAEAFLAYGLDKEHNETILVYDLGGGTFDVSVLDVGEGVFEVKSTDGDTQLGGDDFDQRIVNYVADEFKKQQGIDLRNDRQALQRLREAAEKAKIELSQVVQTTINLPFITADQEGPKHLDITLTRAKFDELTRDLVDRTKEKFQSALQAADITASGIDEIILVGGSTRIPAVQDLVKELGGGKEPHKGVNPDEVVAIGAAIQ